jgi:hypothetical protein
MSKLLKGTFLVHAIVAVILGAALLAAPGRVLGWLGWAPIDPLMSRLLGAALLALAWSSFRGWLASEWSQVAILVEAEVFFTVLACAGLLRHLLRAGYGLVVWGPFAVLAAFAVLWIVSLLRETRAHRPA